jgi:hypothetical protein
VLVLFNGPSPPPTPQEQAADAVLRMSEIVEEFNAMLGPGADPIPVAYPRATRRRQ